MGKTAFAILFCAVSVFAETRIESSITIGPDGVNARVSGAANFSVFSGRGDGTSSPQVIRVEPLPSSLTDSNSFFRDVGKKEEPSSRRPISPAR